MYRQSTSRMVSTKNKNKVLTCSTPEHQAYSPSRDSDSEAASPVPFLCTQDGAEGETDVVWNFYTPKAEHTANSRQESSTPLSHRSKKSLKPRLIQKQLPKRRPPKISQKKTELFQDLIELNQNLHKLITKKPPNLCLAENQETGSEDDIFNESSEYSPKSAPRSSSRCLRKNVLSSCFNKPETDIALESDDSMNECLIKASQVVEENILKKEPRVTRKNSYASNNKNNLNSDINFKFDNDSMDSILHKIKIESPAVSRAKKCDTPCLNNDSFENLVGNLNDSALEQLTQMPVKMNVVNKSKNEESDWTIKELIVHDGSPSSKYFGRHSSMPESPTVTNNKPSTSGMVFGRYSSMPYQNNADKNAVLGDSPIRCTQDEIKKKHQQAREKLMAKRLFPYASSQKTTLAQSCQNIQEEPVPRKKAHFQPKFSNTTNSSKSNKLAVYQEDNCKKKPNSNVVDLKLVIERKRQEALMKLRRHQPQNKLL